VQQKGRIRLDAAFFAFLAGPSTDCEPDSYLNGSLNSRIMGTSFLVLGA